jgi:hypothetical protein
VHLRKLFEVMSKSVNKRSEPIYYYYYFLKTLSCRTACEMFLIYTVITVFNLLSVRGRSRYTAEYHSLSAQRLSEHTVYSRGFLILCGATTHSRAPGFRGF